MEKITERQLMQTLMGYVCGILVCLAGLVFTTWVWYTAGIEIKTP